MKYIPHIPCDICIIWICNMLRRIAPKIHIRLVSRISSINTTMLCKPLAWTWVWSSSHQHSQPACDPCQKKILLTTHPKFNISKNGGWKTTFLLGFGSFSGVYVTLREGITKLYIVPGARVRPSTNHWVSYQPTIGYLTNQLLGISPTNYWVSYQPTYNIPFINFSPPLATHAFNDSGSSTTFILSIFPPPWQPMFSFRV